LFEEIATARPAHFLTVVREIVRRLLRKPEDRVDADLTVALVPLSDHAPVAELARSLAGQLSVFTRAIVLDAAECERRGIIAGPRSLAADHVAWMRLAAWLDERHRERTMVLLVADPEDNAWTRRVLAEANRVLLVGDASENPARLPIEGSLRRRERDTPWEPEIWLVLTHPASTELPSGTARWLAERDVSAHFHVRMGHVGDASRLARFLGRRAVGIALSGGGARGFAHIGVVKSLHEFGIPIDFFAGTSAGSLMGSLLAEDLSAGELDRRVRQGVSGQGNPFGDYTLPMFALLRSRRLRRGIHATFAEIRIEDLWIPCEIVATNLTRAAPTVFRSGPIWKAVLASASPPGATEPVVIGGELYCDGGVVDNVPLDLVEARGCRFRFVSSVASTFEFQVPDGRFPSPWGLLRDKLFGRGRRTPGVPTIMEILVRATTLASDHDLPLVRSRADLFFEAPVDTLPLLDFSEPAAAVEAGRSHAAEVLEGNPLVARLLAEIGAAPSPSG
jgi:predicted acylesterase/phospholipase RssA